MLLQITREALSIVVKHTQARRAEGTWPPHRGRRS